MGAGLTNFIEDGVATFDITTIVRSLHDARHRWRQEQSRASEPGGREFPSRNALAAIIDSLKGVLFPMRLGPPDLRQESEDFHVCLLYTSPSPRDGLLSRMPSSA